MGTYLHSHFLPHRPDQLYDLVADVEKLLRETFRSRVHLIPKSHIDVEYVNGPFQYLNNHWVFKEGPDSGTNIDFFIDFQFRNSFFQSATQVVFESAFNQMLTSFEKQAQQLYGK